VGEKNGATWQSRRRADETGAPKRVTRVDVRVLM
jgi:hypothetical protein